MQKLIKNNWCRDSGECFAKAKIICNEFHPEGLDVYRIRFIEASSLTPIENLGHIISILRGKGKLHLLGKDRRSFHLGVGVHLYLPPGMESVLDAEEGTELLQVSGASASQARGKHFLLRDETFLAACASGSQMLRWILTPQYLSRRIFLHHDPTLLSKSGNPVSWFRTTMFDVTGLPENEDGEPVFKMCYNSRTEFNICYDVKGTARVRMAHHPYKQVKQLWGQWLSIDDDSTYHLNEAAGCPEEECRIDEKTGRTIFLRNKHEVYISDGYVTLFCLFDPAPTGIERHHPGEYSDYEPLSEVIGTELYNTHLREIKRYDEMVDRLSLAKAMGTLSRFNETPFWKLYKQGRETQIIIERKLAATLVFEGNRREGILQQWMQAVTVHEHSFS